MSHYENLSPEELRDRHEELLRLQKQDLDLGQTEGAKEMARERDRLWKAAEKRGVDL